MRCFVCETNKSKIPPVANNGDCLESALDTIKSHYSIIKDILREKEQEIIKLQERNIKLTKAVQLLQRDRIAQKQLLAGQKRRKTNSFESSDQDSITDISYTTDDDVSCTSKLNMALNSEQLQDSSVLSPLTQSQTNAEKIGVGALKQLHEKQVVVGNNFNCEFTFYLNEDSNNENIIPLDNSNWLIKQHITTPTNSKFTKPREKKTTLQKKCETRAHYLAQQLSANRDSSFNQFNSTTSTKRHNSPLKQTRLTQSWLLSNKRTETKRKCDEADDETDMDDDVFDLSTKKPDDAIVKPKILLSSTDSHALEMPTNRTKEEQKDIVTNSFNVNPSLDDSSVRLVPQTQEIIFLDDSFEADIRTMDLLQNVLSAGGEGLENLRDIEKEGIEKLQNQAKDAVGSNLKQKSTFETKAQEHGDIASLVKIKSTVQPLIKREQTSPTARKVQKSISLDSRKKDKHKYDQNMQDLMPKPFNVKNEPSSENLALANQNKRNEKSFPGLRDCTEYISTTPEDFWNPLMSSYPENDPRNEILIDNRFVDKKRKT